MICNGPPTGHVVALGKNTTTAELVGVICKSVGVLLSVVFPVAVIALRGT